jgi:hypothetical protein
MKSVKTAMLVLSLAFAFSALSACSANSTSSSSESTPPSSSESGKPVSSTSAPSETSSRQALPALADVVQLNSALELIPGGEKLLDDEQGLFLLKEYGFEMKWVEANQIEFLERGTPPVEDESYFLLLPRYTGSMIQVERLGLGADGSILVEESLYQNESTPDGYGLVITSNEPETAPNLRVTVSYDDNSYSHIFFYDGRGDRPEVLVYPTDENWGHKLDEASMADPVFTKKDLDYAVQQADLLTEHLIAYSYDYSTDSFDKNAFLFALGGMFDPDHPSADYADYELYKGFFTRGESSDSGVSILIFPARKVNQTVYEVFGAESWTLEGGDVTFYEETQQYETNLEFGFAEFGCQAEDISSDNIPNTDMIETGFTLFHTGSVNGDPAMVSAGQYMVTYQIMRENERLFLRFVEIKEEGSTVS